MTATSSLQEVIFAAHFQAPLQLTVLEFADWARSYELEFPIVQQLVPHPTVALNPAAIPAFQMVTAPELPRLVLRSSTTRILQLQADRVAYGWARDKPIGQEAEYPGYEVLRAEFVEILRLTSERLSSRLNGALTLRLAELSYFNAAPLVVDGKAKRISEVTSFVNPGDTPRKVHQFSCQWTELFDDRPDAARVMATTGIFIAPPDIRALGMNFSGLFPVECSAIDAALCEAFDSLHIRIHEMRDIAIVPGAFQ